MFLLTEQSDKIELLTENTESGKKLYIEGVFAQADIVNRNGRRYGRNLMEKSLDEYINEFVNSKRAIGELNHPDYPLPNMKNAAILIQEMKWLNSTDVYGKALVLESTHDGNIIKALMEAGFNMGVSTRGMGDVRESRGILEVTKYKMTAVDCVSNPSAPDANVKLINESMDIEYVQVDGKWVLNETFNMNKFNNNLDRLIENYKSYK